MSRCTYFVSVSLLSVLTLGCGEGGDSTERPPLYEGEDGRQRMPANVVGGFEAQLPETTLTPGEESFVCFIIPLEMVGESKIVGGAKLTATPGLHHGNVTTRLKTGEGLRACEAMDLLGGNEALDMVEGGAWLFASSTGVVGEEWQTFADGQGFRIKEDHEIVARMHYLNTTSEEVTVAPKYEWFTIDESKVEHVLAPFGFTFGGFSIPPMSTKTVTGNCELPKPFNIVHLLPHMHQLGDSLTAEFLGGERDGEMFLDSQGYDPEAGVIQQYEPAVDLSIASGVRFSCTWNNTFDKEIKEGVGDDEMCMLFGYGYPEDSVYFGFAYADGECVPVPVPAPGDE
jgi:hypothetical protein